MVEKRNCQCLNIGVDGESLHLATDLPDGVPGTELSLAKCLNKKLQAFNKEMLQKFVSENSEIALDFEPAEEDTEEVEEQVIIGDDIIAYLEDSLAAVQQKDIEDNFSLEDIEDLLKCELVISNKSREAVVKKYSIVKLREICLNHIFPVIKKKWLIQHFGKEKLLILFENGGKVEYIPSNVFHQTDSGFFRTVTFDYAHILNLYRESAAKGKLQDMGLTPDSLSKLSKEDGFKYLQKIIAVEKGKLKFDSMNQKAAAALFSDKTVSGLKLIKDYSGARCVEKISSGLSAFDESGVSSRDRILNLISLKNFINDQNSVLDRLRRPSDRKITNELLMMTLCSIDSFVVTYLNLQFFNPRRKSTSTVEMLFGQLMMMTDGSTRLNVRQLQDVLQRLTISSALRLLPLKVRGFKFLGNLKRHMKSYHPDDSEAVLEDGICVYPKLTLSSGTAQPLDSSFDKSMKSNKRKFKDFARENIGEDRVRKFHGKF